jgi:Flp pilus assembly pilin Flp
VGLPTAVIAGKATAGVELYELNWWNFCSDEGQDFAEYAVMLAVILVLVVATVKLIGTNAQNVFNAVANTLSLQ